MSVEELSQEIIELQTKIQFQEDTIQQLDSVIVQQNYKIDELSRRLVVLEDKLDNLQHLSEQAKIITDEKPPHY